MFTHITAEREASHTRHLHTPQAHGGGLYWRTWWVGNKRCYEGQVCIEGATVKNICVAPMMQLAQRSDFRLASEQLRTVTTAHECTIWNVDTDVILGGIRRYSYAKRRTTDGQDQRRAGFCESIHFGGTRWSLLDPKTRRYPAAVLLNHKLAYRR